MLERKFLAHASSRRVYDMYREYYREGERRAAIDKSCGMAAAVRHEHSSKYLSVKACSNAQAVSNELEISMRGLDWTLREGGALWSNAAAREARSCECYGCASVLYFRSFPSPCRQLFVYSSFLERLKKLNGVPSLGVLGTTFL